MKILFITQGDKNYPSSRFMVWNFIPYFQKCGISCHTIILNNTYSNSILKIGLLLRIKSIINFLIKMFLIYFKLLFYKFDIVYLQKPISRNHYPFFEYFISLINKNFIFSFEDAEYYNNKYFGSILRFAKEIIVLNEYNKCYALKYNKNVNIITNPIETNNMILKEYGLSKNKIIIGRIGSPVNTKELLTLSSVFGKLNLKYKDKVILKTIGAEKFDSKDVGGIELIQKVWSRDTEDSEILSFDIGVMPLEDTDYNRGKGGCKLLQYMSKGICSVASPVGVNSEIVNNGVDGFLAKNDLERVSYISKLIDNQKLRENIGKAAIIKVENNYSINHYLPIYLNLFKSTLSG